MTERRTLIFTNPTMSGEDVLEMQRLLIKALGVANSRMALDGVFGPVTLDQVAKFQHAKKMKVDGICGPKTWARLYYEAGPRYACTTSDKILRIDEETALWLMRMVVGEGGSKCSARKTAALCWAIVNRWFLWPGADNYSGFVSMLRAFSQPINPRWMEGGDLAEKYAGKGPASPSRLKRRAKICAMTLRDIPMSIRKNVELFADGKLVLPHLDVRVEKMRISNWASLGSTHKKYPWGVDVCGEWFFEDSNLRDGFVEVG